MKCDELEIKYVGYGMGFYPTEDVDTAIDELKDENCKLKRALWLARADRARDNSILLPSKFMRNVWDNVERKCRAKAEEY